MVFVLVLLSVSVLLLIFYRLWMSPPHGGAEHHLNKIPGPRLPMFVGNTFQLIKPREEVFRVQRQYALEYFPIYKVWNIRNNIVSLMHPEDIKMVLTTDKCIQDARLFHEWFGLNLITSNGDAWRQKRKVLNPCFAYSSLPKWLNAFNQNTKLLIQDIEQRINSPVGISKLVGVFTIHCIQEALFGPHAKISVSALKYLEAANLAVDIIDYKICRPWLYIDAIYKRTALSQKEREVIKLLREYPQDSIDKRSPIENHEELEQDGTILDALLRAKSEGKIPDHESIRDEINGLLAAGYNTLTESLSFLLMLLANHPEIQDRLFQEMNEIFKDNDGLDPTFQELQRLSYMDACINESLRLYPNVNMVPRRTTEEIKLYTGYIIPKDTIVLAQLFDMHHNPQLHPDPEKFNPGRFLSENKEDMKRFSHLPFGAGPRKCIGQKFAILEIKVALCSILRKFTLEPVDTPRSFSLVGNFFMKPKTELKIKFQYRE